MGDEPLLQVERELSQGIVDVVEHFTVELSVTKNTSPNILVELDE